MNLKRASFNYDVFLLDNRGYIVHNFHTLTNKSAMLLSRAWSDERSKKVKSNKDRIWCKIRSCKVSFLAYKLKLYEQNERVGTIWATSRNTTLVSLARLWEASQDNRTCIYKKENL